MKERDKIQKIDICGVIYPAFDRNSVVWRTIRMEFKLQLAFLAESATFMKQITDWWIIQNDHFAQIRLNRSNIFYVRAISVGAVLPVISAFKIFAVLL